MFESTGKSAITAVVITELFSEDEFDEEEVVRAPPVTGFNPRIHTKCCSVCKIIEIVVNLFEYVNIKISRRLILILIHLYNLIYSFIYVFNLQTSKLVLHARTIVIQQVFSDTKITLSQ